MSDREFEKILAQRGYGSRKEVRHLLRSERVQPEPTAGVTLDQITIDGEKVDPERLVVALHKPVGYVCSLSDKEGRTIYELFPERWTRRRPAFVSAGRLDKESSGLIIVTDDGELIHRLTSPKKHLPKIYQVRFEGELPQDAIELFKSGTIVLEDEPCAPAYLTPLGANLAEVTMYEGRYHQVRRMFEHIGNPVVGLHRTRIGSLQLGELKVGSYQILSEAQELGMFKIDSPCTVL